MATCQKRLVANPSMGIGDLMKAMTNFLDEQCDLDLHAAVSPPGHNVWSWKTAPNLSWMAKISALAIHFLNFAPNGVLSSSKLKNAVLKLAAVKKINRTRYADIDFADQVDLRIRVVLAQFRLLKQKTEEYQKAMRKASPEEKQAVDHVLSRLILDTMETPSGPVSNSDLQMVPYSGSSGSNSAAIGAATTMEPKDSQSVFARILARRSSPEQIAPAPGQNLQRQNASFFCAPDQQIAPAEGQNQQRKPGFFCVPPSESSETEPPTPVVNAKQKRKSILDQKPLAQCGLGEEDEAILQQALGTSVPVQATRQKRNKVLKKPGAKVGKHKQTKEGSGPASSSNANAEAEKKTNKCTFKHRKTSAAYHAAKKRALQDGHSPSTAKSLGRAASSKVASSIDAGILKE